jgi:enolase
MVNNLNMIKKLEAREILDSRGNPTVEVSLTTEKGEFISSVPSGASTGTYEAKELRDGDHRYAKKGVLRAVENINQKIAPLILNKEIDPFLFDRLMIELDGTDDKSNIGANAILPVSMSVFRAAAAQEGKELYEYISEKSGSTLKLPIPCFNIINGGLHGCGGVSFQEFMIVPDKNSFSENLRFAVEFTNILKEKIATTYGIDSVNIGDEGGFVPKIESEKEVLDLLKSCDKDLRLIIDVASTEIYKDDKYHLSTTSFTREELIDFYQEILSEFNVLGLEDPLQENDFLGWKELKEKTEGVLIIGDDILVTNTKRMEFANKNNSCNAMILKINQIGSISEALQAAKKAKEYGWEIIVSHRSGETNDDFIADFAVGIGAKYIKSGAPKRGERVAKYNRLLKIEKLINK